MRAIGASNRAVMQVVLAEGLVIGLVSWAVSVVLALPLGMAMTGAVGAAIIGSPLAFSYSLEGAAIWLAAVIVVSLLAGALPARGASRITIREALAYE